MSLCTALVGKQVGYNRFAPRAQSADDAAKFRQAVQRAFSACALVAHPDKASHPQAAAAFKLLQSARQALNRHVLKQRGVARRLAFPEDPPGGEPAGGEAAAGGGSAATAPAPDGTGEDPTALLGSGQRRVHFAFEVRCGQPRWREREKRNLISCSI